MRLSAFLACLALSGFTPAAVRAQAGEFCADRPGLGTPTCTLEPGQAMVEVTGLEIDHSADFRMEETTLTFVDSVLRLGLGGNTEVQLGITGYVHAEQWDRIANTGSSAQGIGDSVIAVRHGLPGRKVAVQAYVSLPTGADGVGDGTWGAGLLLPIDLPSAGVVEFALTPAISAVPDESGDGRHLAYGAVVGLSAPLSPRLTGSVELSGMQDDEPGSPLFESTAAISLAWQTTDRLQLDAEMDVMMSGGASGVSALLGLAFQL